MRNRWTCKHYMRWIEMWEKKWEIPGKGLVVQNISMDILSYKGKRLWDDVLIKTILDR